jgi:hypothetical protein
LKDNNKLTVSISTKRNSLTVEGDRSAVSWFLSFLFICLPGVLFLLLIFYPCVFISHCYCKLFSFSILFKQCYNWFDNDLINVV